MTYDEYINTPNWYIDLKLGMKEAEYKVQKSKAQ